MVNMRQSPDRLRSLYLSGVVGAFLLAVLSVLATDRGGATAANPQPSAATGPAGAKKNADGTFGKDHIDPVKMNGPIFVDWDQPAKPRAVLLFTGAQNGYIEPCGCAGLENQKGGMSRRHQLLKSLADLGWPVAAIDTGGLVKEQTFGKQAVLKYNAAVAALKTMKYQVVGLGAAELRLPVDEIISQTAQDGKDPSPFISANVALISFADQLTDRARVITLNGIKIGITSVVSAGEYEKLNNQSLEFKPPEAALREVLPGLLKADCQRLVLLFNGDEKDAVELIKKFPQQFTDVVVTGGADEPPAQVRLVPGTRTLLIETGHKGMYAVALGIFNDARQPLRYQRVPLDARFGDSDELKKQLADYQDQLRDLGLKGLGLDKSPPHPTGRAFVGSQVCGDCHTKAYAIWSKTPHAHATETLVNLDPPRHFDPECLSCHATGWDAQRFFPFTTGYQGLKETPDLVANGCENCHGPGKKHADAELGNVQLPQNQILALRAAMRVSLAEAKKSGCVQCHDIDNSPQFNFETYWPQVEHKGKD